MFDKLLYSMGVEDLRQLDFKTGSQDATGDTVLMLPGDPNRIGILSASDFPSDPTTAGYLQIGPLVNGAVHPIAILSSANQISRVTVADVGFLITQPLYLIGNASARRWNYTVVRYIPRDYLV